MKIDPDDPRLTAYALGELPEDQAQRLESDLADSPDAREVLEQTRALSTLLTQGFAAELAPPTEARILPTEEPGIDSSAADSVDETKPTPIVPFPRPPLAWGFWIAAAAVCLGLASFLMPGRKPTEPRDLQLASRSLAPVTASEPVASPAEAPSSYYADAPVPHAGGQDTRSLRVGSTAAPNAPNPSTPPTPELMRRYGLAPSSGPTPTAPPASATALVTSPRVAPGAQPTTVAPPARPGSPISGIGVERSRMQSRYGRNATGLADQEAPPLGALLNRPSPTPLATIDPPPARAEERARASLTSNPGYLDVDESPFRSAGSEPLSTFALDVDTGSYANLRRFLNAGQAPPREAVRLEEMINYFRYDVTDPRDGEVFGVTAEVAECPWAAEHRLVRIVVKARELEGPRPPGNLVFLIDVSGSMAPPERLPLLKQSLKALARRLAPSDRLAIVTYASSAGVALDSTSAENKEAILEAIDRLQPGGTTNGEGGLRTAYEVARSHYLRGGVNRVLLCTDGDFNVGISDQNDLVRLIQEQARSGVFLTTLGVGTDNYKDALMRRLADHGNGSYHYLDSFEEAQRVLIGQRDATFVTVAREAKAQVEFNPSRIGAWRLLGYEKRLLAHTDFNDDTKDAGEIGAGHVVTVLYEITPPGATPSRSLDPLKYQRPAEAPSDTRVAVPSTDLLTLKLRYQSSEGSPSRLLERAVRDESRPWAQATPDFKFVAAVASFGLVLRDSPYRGEANLASVLAWGRAGLGADPEGWRAEFLALVQKAASLARELPARRL